MKNNRGDERVYSFRFQRDNPLHKQARAILDNWIDDYNAQHQVNRGAIIDIVVNLILEHEGKKTPPPSDRRMFQILSGHMEKIEALLLDIRNRAPEQYQGAVQQAHEGGDIDDDLYHSLLGDFNNVEGR